MYLEYQMYIHEAKLKILQLTKNLTARNKQKTKNTQQQKQMNKNKQKYTTAKQTKTIQQNKQCTTTKTDEQKQAKIHNSKKNKNKKTKQNA